MAYTYDDFVSAASSAGMMGEFSEYDLQTARNDPEYGLSILRLKQDAANATTEEQRLLANEAANQLRSAYGNRSSGTGYQNQIDGLIGRIDSYGSFNYRDQDAYDKLLAGLVDRQPFSYDPETDPSWGAYRKAYLREGDRASANAMAQAAAASGGRPSSYAMTAAQQAGNYYAGQLADMLPTLEQNAYSRYMDELNAQLNSLGALQTDRNTNYQQWMDQYEMLQNSLGNYQTQAATEYQKQLDAYEQQYRAEQDARDQQQQAFSNALAILQNTGYATPEAAKILGIPAGYYGSPTGEPEEEPVEEPTTEPDTGGPGATLPEGKQTEKTDKFVKGFTLTWEDAQRMGMSKDQYLAMVEDRVLRSGLSDEEIVWLGEHYGLDFAKRVG